MDQEEVRRRQVQVQRDLLHSQGSQTTAGISGVPQEAPRRNPQATKPEITEAQQMADSLAREINRRGLLVRVAQGLAAAEVAGTFIHETAAQQYVPDPPGSR